MNITRKLDDTKVYQHCKTHGYYTHGTNREYMAMFDKCREAKTDNDIIAVCKDIWEHSDTAELEQGGVDFECFVWGVFNKCITFEVNAE